MEQVSRLHGTEIVCVLEIVWLLCNEAQHVGCPQGLEGCPLVWTQASSHNLQGVVDGGVNKAGMSTVDAGIQSQFARRR